MTVRHILADVKCFFRWCEDAGWLDRAPIPHRLLPKSQERPPDRLSDAEVDALLAVPEPYAFIVRLALGTGLRWGELMRASSSDLEMARTEAGAMQGILVVHHTKSWKVRRVPLTQALWSELRRAGGQVLAACGRMELRGAGAATLGRRADSTRISCGTRSRVDGWSVEGVSRRCNRFSATRPS
jgi:integrase